MTISKVFVPKARKNKRAIEVGYFTHHDFKVCCKRKHTFVLFSFNTFYIVLEIVFHFQLEIFIFIGAIKNLVTLHFFKGLKKLHNFLEC
jgi:hypothetical protein